MATIPSPASDQLDLNDLRQQRRAEQRFKLYAKRDQEMRAARRKLMTPPRRLGTLTVRDIVARIRRWFAAKP